MTRRYEVVYIFNSSLEEAQVDERLARYHALLKSEENPEPVEQVNHWGKRSLAYPIKGSEVGHYVVAHFATDPTLLPEYERILKLEEESVIRYLLVINEAPVQAPAPEQDEEAAEATEKQEVAKGAAE
jgi:small subunit ribosomal protein S6